MPELIAKPSRVEAAGQPPKAIEEYVGLVDTGDAHLSVALTKPGEWVRYSTPGAQGAEYISVCLPAFSLSFVHRDD